jgi:hypothetical protein
VSGPTALCVTGHLGCDLFPSVFWAAVYSVVIQAYTGKQHLRDPLLMHTEDSAPLIINPPSDMNIGQSNAVTIVTDFLMTCCKCLDHSHVSLHLNGV